MPLKILHHDDLFPRHPAPLTGWERLSRRLDAVPRRKQIPKLAQVVVLGTLAIGIFIGLQYTAPHKNELLTRLGNEPIAVRFGLPAPSSNTLLYRLESTPKVELYWALNALKPAAGSTIPVPGSSKPTG